ncbi:hypothetical protein F5876DRAFT_83317 [Lentinula aff. lateritia]|uniref:Uncharacterized protein n=1 Tax=Lentinula aff. lateritia TaxID=2804960 RepID=A0ACC1TI04_9AGAR|nr:hypothetical protein F5876DRAFT_83317 [Lentinula aff. lateritia]
MSIVNNVQSVLKESDILDVYTVHNGNSHISSPFSMDISLSNFDGRQAAVEAMVDDSAMVAAMDVAVYERLRTTIGGWEPTQQKFRMANGSVVPGTARWKGHVSVQGMKVDGEFEVFDSGGGWKFLFGKPLLERFAAVHDYQKDAIVLRGEQGKWQEVFNKGLGVVLSIEPPTVLEESGQQEIPSSQAQGLAVLEESEGPLSGVIVKALTPLSREVEDLASVQQERITNGSPQHIPRVETPQRRRRPQVEDAPDDDPVQLKSTSGEHWDDQKRALSFDGEEWHIPEHELDTWFREERRMRRERAIEWQKELEFRQEERRVAWEKEEVQREVEWTEWLRKQRAEPGLHKWFFWRNCLKRLHPPKRLSVESPGGSSASPSREVPAACSSTDWHQVDHVTADAWTHSMTEKTLGEVGMQPNIAKECLEKKEIEGLPGGMRVDSVGGIDVPPSRGVSNNNPHADAKNANCENVAPMCILQEGNFMDSNPLGPDFFPDALDQSGDVNLFTCNDGERGAFHLECVKEILRKVKIGPELSADQRRKVEQLLSEYADCFALSVGEVRPVKNAVHRLNIPEGATFPKKVRQKSLTPPQREYLHAKVDELLEAGVIEHCNPEDVKCVLPLILAQKAHEGKGLMVEELMHKLNNECVATGLPTSFDLPTRPQPSEPMEHADLAKPAKWRICQNFMAVNKLTEIAPMPQGNIRSKQQSAYSISQGKGYFWCAKLPFGLTGAPSTFANMTALHLDNLIVDGTIELFMDDGGSADDDFESMFAKLTRILE